MKTINEIKLSDLRKYCELNYNRALHEIRKQHSSSHMLYCVDNDTVVAGCFSFNESELGANHWHTLLHEILEHHNKKQKYTGSELMIRYNNKRDWQKLEFMEQIASLLNHIEDNK